MNNDGEERESVEKEEIESHHFRESSLDSKGKKKERGREEIYRLCDKN